MDLVHSGKLKYQNSNWVISCAMCISFNRACSSTFLQYWFASSPSDNVQLRNAAIWLYLPTPDSDHRISVRVPHESRQYRFHHAGSSVTAELLYHWAWTTEAKPLTCFAGQW